MAGRSRIDGSKAGHGIRRCVACGGRASRWGLLRFVLLDDRLEFDQSGTAPKRGVYLHAEALCLARAGNLKLFERGLRVPAGTIAAESFGPAIERARVDSRLKGNRDV